MGHPLYRVTGFEVVAPYTLRVRFDDASSQTIDFRQFLTGEMYSPLNHLESFNRVKLDTEIHTLVWPNGADFDPATLHDWPAHEDALRARAKRWREIQV